MKIYTCFILILCTFGLTANAQGNLQRTPKGDLYTIFTHNTGDKLKVNDIVTLEVTQKTDKDSIISSTYATGSPIKIQVQPSQSITDLMEVFPLLTVNDSVLVKVPADSVFKGHEDKRPPFFPAGSYFNFYIKVLKVQTIDEVIAEMKADEIADANKYIADNKLIVKTTPSGLRYFIAKTSPKPKPQPGDTVLVNYTGKLLSGVVFDSSVASVAQAAGLQQPGRTYEPLKIVVGTGDVIKGWDEALLLLNEGAAGTFIIPSSLAYGEQGQGPIPPFSTLVFDIQLVSVKHMPHHQAAPLKKPLVKKPHPMVKKKS